MNDNNLLMHDNKEELSAKTKQTVFKKTINYTILVLSIVFSIVTLIMFFSAADSIKTGGLEIMGIQSVGGMTLEEAYYYGLGYIYEGYCLATRALGVFCSSVLLLFGISRVKNV